MASTGENRGATVVLLLPSCCAIFFLFSKVPSTQAHSRGSVWNRGRTGGGRGGGVGCGQELLSCISLNIWIQLPHHSVTSGRHKNQSCEMKSGAFHSFVNRLNYSSISRAAPVLTWRTHCRIPVCAWILLSSVTFNS